MCQNWQCWDAFFQEVVFVRRICGGASRHGTNPCGVLHVTCMHWCVSVAKTLCKFVSQCLWRWGHGTICKPVGRGGGDYGVCVLDDSLACINCSSLAFLIVSRMLPGKRCHSTSCSNVFFFLCGEEQTCGHASPKKLSFCFPGWLRHGVHEAIVGV